MQPAANELAAIAACFKKKNFTSFMSSGVKLEGIKYQFLREDEGFVYAKKKDHGSVSLQSTNTAIVIAHCPEGKQQGNCNKAVAVIVEYLKSIKY